MSLNLNSLNVGNGFELFILFNFLSLQDALCFMLACEHQTILTFAKQLCRSDTKADLIANSRNQEKNMVSET